MTLFAFLPTTTILTLKQLEARTNMFPKTSALIGGLKGSRPDIWGRIPEFEHELLRKDWMPEFHWDRNDRNEFLEARKKFPWMDSVLGRKEDSVGGKSGRSEKRSKRREKRRDKR